MMILADGFGPDFCGQTAADTTLSVLKENLAQQPLHRSAFQLQRTINGAFSAANAAIVRQARASGKTGIGCSAIVAVRIDATLLIKAVGDCRAYLLRHHRLQQLTNDHTLTQFLASTGQISDRLTATRRDVLLNYLGQHDFEPNSEFSAFEVADGDRILMANKGLTSVLHRGQFQDILSSAASATEAASELGNQALRDGAPDTLTCITIDVQGVCCNDE